MQIDSSPDVRTTPAESWQAVLIRLLQRHQNLNALRQSARPPPGQTWTCFCPFTRRGLSDLFRISQADYTLMRELSAFDLPPDPTSPHTYEGGHSFCNASSHFKALRELEQHCGPQSKTTSIGRLAPQVADADQWRRFPAHEQLHYLLLRHIGGGQGPRVERERLSAHESDLKMLWPPMLSLFGIQLRSRDDQVPNSGAKLKERFGQCSHAYPVYRGADFAHEAVLVFTSGGLQTDTSERHKEAFERAAALEEELRREGSFVRQVRFCESGDLDGWQRQSSAAWCNQLLRKHGSEITTRKLMDVRLELAKSREKLNAEKAQLEAKLKEEEEARAKIEAYYQEKLDEVRQQHAVTMRENEEERRRLEHRLNISFEAICLQETQMVKQREVMEQRHRNVLEALRVQQERMQLVFDETAKRERLRELDLQEKDKELKLAKEEMHKRARQMDELASRQHVDAARVAEHEAEKEKVQKERIQMADKVEELQAQMEQVKIQSAREKVMKEEEIARAKTQIVKTEGELQKLMEDEKGVAGNDEQLLYDNAVKGMVHMVEEQLKRYSELLHHHNEDSPDDTSRFYYRTLGRLDSTKVLKLMGLRGKYSELGSKDVTLTFEVGAWEKGLVDEIEYKDGIPSSYMDPLTEPTEHIKWQGEDVPHFKARDVFLRRNGVILPWPQESRERCDPNDWPIREEDKQYPVFHPITKELLKKETVYSAEWVKYIRRRFPKKADKIFKYLLERKREIDNSPRGSQASNYSLPSALWDKKDDKPATPLQKMALLVQAINLDIRRDHGPAVLPFSETFGGKSFHDKANMLLYWDPRAMDSEAETTDGES